MSEESIPLFCPECGSMLDEKPVCQRCGFDIKKGVVQGSKKPQPVVSSSNSTTVGMSPTSLDENTTMPQSNKKEKKKKVKKQKAKKTGNNEVLLGDLIKKIGPYLWIINIVFAIGPWINSMVITFGGSFIPDLAYDFLFWTVFGVLFSVLVSLIYLKPLSEKIEEGEWDAIITDYTKFGKYQIPQLLFMAILQTIIISLWGSIPLVIVAILICFTGDNAKKIEWNPEK